MYKHIRCCQKCVALRRNNIGKLVSSLSFLHGFVTIFFASFWALGIFLYLFCDCLCVLHGLVQSDILDHHSETAYMNHHEPILEGISYYVLQVQTCGFTLKDPHYNPLVSLARKEGP